MMVNFTGAVNGSTRTDASGYYRYVTSTANLGTVTAQAFDMSEMLMSNRPTAAVNVAAPTVIFDVTNGSRKTVTLKGTVTDLDAGGRTVSFNGAVTGTVTTAADGSFSLTTQANSVGKVTASTANAWGVASAPAESAVKNKVPGFKEFWVECGMDYVTSAWGIVDDEDPDGLTVNFTGPGFDGKSPRVYADGSFSLTLQVPKGSYGIIWAQTTDWYGQTSAPRGDTIDATI